MATVTRVQAEAMMFCFGFLLVIPYFCSAKGLNNELSDNEHFRAWISEYGKKYGSEAEYLSRKSIYLQNKELVEMHNAEEHSYSLELNHFADMTFKEFKENYLLSTPQNCSATHNSDTLMWKPTVLPPRVDWRKKGVVSAVKNQGGCGSCWTFSTTGAMEAHMAISYQVHYNLSEQQLVDCAQAFNNHGCEGGLPSQAFEYIRYNPGLTTEQNYPYQAKDLGKCDFKSTKAVAFVQSVVNITEHDEMMLQQAVATAGPVSIAYDVAADFRFYKSGVYQSTKCKTDPEHVNHAVLAVGYDQTPEGTPYWIVKNSWGESFGMKGYFNILRGQNECGLADCASYPIVKNKP